jgi:Fe2+ or Zn2+ uptake regulation protein
MLQSFEKDNDLIITDHTFFLTGVCPECKKMK